MRITTENPLDFNCKKALILRRNKTIEYIIADKKQLGKSEKIILKAANKFAYARLHMSVKQWKARIGKYIIDNRKFIIGILTQKKAQSSRQCRFCLKRRELCPWSPSNLLSPKLRSTFTMPPRRKKKTDGNFSRPDLINCHKKLCYSVGDKIAKLTPPPIFNT